jgi:hypothetical protein
MAKFYYCPVCKKAYAEPLAAIQCPEKYGYPKSPKFALGQKVQIRRRGEPTKEWEIIKIAYSQPGWISRQPHQIVYLLCQLNQPGPLILTTATETGTEEEMTPI